MLRRVISCHIIIIIINEFMLLNSINLGLRSPGWLS